MHKNIVEYVKQVNYKRWIISYKEMKKNSKESRTLMNEKKEIEIGGTGGKKGENEKNMKIVMEST